MTSENPQPTQASPSDGPHPEPQPQDLSPHELNPQTLPVVLGRPERRPGAPVGPSLQLTSTFQGAGPVPPAPGDAAQPAYGRPDNQTVQQLEAVLAAMEGSGTRLPTEATVFASGMAAISAVLALVPPGRPVVAPTAAYNTTLELLNDLDESGRVRLQRVDIADTATVLDALAGKGPHGAELGPAALLWIESPTNPLLEIADLPALIAAAHEHGCLVVVDNTFATPLLQQPLRLGADVVVHSVTKYLAGHSDVVMGAMVTSEPGLTERLRRHRRVHGGIAGPFEAWLALRGVRTLAVRLERQLATAGTLAARLSEHPRVKRVRYPGLATDPGHERASAQMSGYTAMLAIEVDGDAAAADRVVAACRLWVPATSLGGVESLIERRRRIASEPDAVPPNLLRLSVGIEHPDDLWADLDAALRQS